MRILKFIPLLVILYSCKKTNIPDSVSDSTSSDGMQTGMPDNINAINGYLFASYNGSTKNNRYLTTYAVFGDPARNLLSTFDHYEEDFFDQGPNNGNVSVGPFVSFSGTSSYNGFSGASSTFPSVTYANFNRYIGGQTPFANWKYNGNKSFKVLDIYVQRGFPVLNDSLIKNLDTVKVSQGYKIVTDKRFYNYDSLTVTIDANSDPDKVLKKTFAAGVPVELSTAELAQLLPSSLVTISFKAYNYSYQILEGKKLLYELSGLTNDKALVLLP